MLIVLHCLTSLFAFVPKQHVTYPDLSGGARKKLEKVDKGLTLGHCVGESQILEDRDWETEALSVLMITFQRNGSWVLRYTSEL